MPNSSRHPHQITPQGGNRQHIVNYIWSILGRSDEDIDLTSEAHELSRLLRHSPKESIVDIVTEGITWQVAMHIYCGPNGEYELTWNTRQLDHFVEVFIMVINRQSSEGKRVIADTVTAALVNAHNKISRYDSQPVDPSNRWRYSAAYLHVQCHAFASRLFERRIIKDDMLLVQVMREAFEVDNPEANVSLTLVAVYSYLVRDHDEFVSRIEERRTTRRSWDYRYATGKIYHELGGLMVLDESRWNYWKDRFLEMTEGRYDQSHVLRQTALGMHRFGTVESVDEMVDNGGANVDAQGDVNNNEVS